MGWRQRMVGGLINAYLGDAMRDASHRLHRWGDRGAELEIYLQVDDPYSHLLAQRLPPLVEGAGLTAEVIVVPAPGLEVDPQPEARRRYALRDAAELSRRYELDFPDAPQLPSTDAVLTANAILLEPRPAMEQLKVAEQVGAALFEGDRAQLGRLAREHGKVEAPSVAKLLREGQQRLQRAGHYMGAMLRFEGEWYWGVDRLWHLEQRLRRDGRAACRGLVPRPEPAPPVLALDGAPVLDFYLSFRSPFSYLAVDRIRDLSARYGVELCVKPVLPMVMRGLAVPNVKRLHIARDAAREARRRGIDFGHICDPLGVGIERCLAAFEIAEAEGLGVELVASAGRGIWSEALDVADDHDLAIIVRRAGLHWERVQRAIAGCDWRPRVERHQRELASLGLWGVPCFKIGDYACWGQDRIDGIEDRLAWLWWSEPDEESA